MTYDDSNVEEVGSDKPMLDANDARSLTKENIFKRKQKEYERQISKVVDDLYDAIDGGQYEFTFGGNLLEDIVNDLKDLGYNVEYVDRKGIGQNYFKISWQPIEKKRGKK